MENIFNIINNYISKNVDITYGEIGSNQIENRENIIKRLCSRNEYIQYKQLQNFDKKKICTDLNNKNNNTNTNNVKKEVYVNGIGKVTQIC